tara:strand:+ start:3855 stop:4157 length:303 start_codon:yes stop_codon:yes gene_type:complete
MSGHIIDMVNRIRQNKIPQRKKFQGDNRSMLYIEPSEVNYDFAHPTPDELQKIKLTIRQEALQNKKNSLFLLAACIVVIALLMTLFLLNYDFPFATLGKY